VRAASSNVRFTPKSGHRTKHCSFVRWVVVVVSERPAGRLPRVSSTDCGAGTGNFDQDQGAMRRGCNDCKVGPGRPLSYESLRDEVRSFCRSPVRQPDDAVSLPRTLALFGTLRQSRRFSSFSRRLCCERAGHFQKQVVSLPFSASAKHARHYNQRCAAVRIDAGIGQPVWVLYS